MRPEDACVCVQQPSRNRASFRRPLKPLKPLKPAFSKASQRFHDHFYPHSSTKTHNKIDAINSAPIDLGQLGRLLAIRRNAPDAAALAQIRHQEAAIAQHGDAIGQQAGAANDTQVTNEGLRSVWANLQNATAPV